MIPESHSNFGTTTNTFGSGSGEFGGASLGDYKIGSGDITANQAYKDAQDKGFQGSFKQFMEMASEKGWLDKAVGVFDTLFGKRPTTTNVAIPEKDNKILGLNPVVFWVGTAVVVAGVGYGFYRAVK